MIDQRHIKYYIHIHFFKLKDKRQYIDLEDDETVRTTK